MATINPYLTFDGNAEEAFNFYKSVFGGDFMGGINRFKDMPDSENLPEEDGEKVMHVALPIGNGSTLMASDTIEGMGQAVKPGNNFTISIHPENEEEANRLFDGLSAGGNVTMPLEKVFWAELFGQFTDKFGIQWMVNYEGNQNN